MTTSRRDFIVGAGAAIAVANLPARAAGADKDAAALKLLAEFAEELLVDYPESATGLGIDTGPRAALKARLSDRSAAGQEAIARRVAKRLERMKSIDSSGLGEAARIDVDVMRTAHEFAAEGFAFPYGDVALLNSSWSWRNAPYVVAQNTGAFLEIPSMLDEQHTVETREDADAYLSRLEAYAGQLDGETGRLQTAAGQGCDRAGFSARQDAQSDQDRARRKHRGLVARDLAREADESNVGRLRLARRRRLQQTKWRRRSTARSPSWKRIAGAQPVMRACGSFRKAMRTTRGR